LNTAHLLCFDSRAQTALNKLIQTGKIAVSKDEVAQEHFAVLVETLEANDLYTMNCQFWKNFLKE
jgi:hypothetical protein